MGTTLTINTDEQKHNAGFPATLNSSDQFQSNVQVNQHGETQILMCVALSGTHKDSTALA